MEFLKDYSLADMTTWKIGGNADWAAFPVTVEDAREACRWALEKSLPITVLSGGSNVLVSDKGIEGLVICLTRFTGISDLVLTGETLTLTCPAGTPKSEVLKVFVKHRMSPAIFLAGLPGDMGGGVVMNAGVSHDVSPKEFVEIIDWVEMIDLNDKDLKIRRKKASELTWNYRKCSGWQPGLITRMGVRWTGSTDDGVLKKLQEGNKRRMTTQPLQLPSCGSVFKNPPGDKSGRLIEQCGLKGFTSGGAQVSEKHANFIVNIGGATSADILAVVRHVQATVRDQKQISLEPEFVFLGRR